jgi:hypothetical protein
MMKKLNSLLATLFQFNIAIASNKPIINEGEFNYIKTRYTEAWVK